MKVLLVSKWNCGLFSHEYSYHGEWRDTYELALALQRQGIQTGIVAPKPLLQHMERFDEEFGDILNQKGIQFFFMPAIPPTGNTAWLARWHSGKTALKAAYQFRPDVIQPVRIAALFPRWMWAKSVIVQTGYFSAAVEQDQKDVKSWASNRLSVSDQFVALLARTINKVWKLDQIDNLPRQSDALVMLHQQGYQQLTKRLPGFVKYIPKGVDLETADACKPAKPEPTQETKKLNILFNGILYYRKGIFELIEALRQVSQAVPNAHLTIIGSGPANLQRQIHLYLEKYGLTEKATLLGPVGPVNKWASLWQCDVFCLPSYKDAFPSVIIEACACGKPVITTWEIDTRIVDGESGLRVHAGDVEALAEAIITLLQNDTLRMQMGRSARAVAEANSWDHAAEEFIRLYDELVA